MELTYLKSWRANHWKFIVRRWSEPPFHIICAFWLYALPVSLHNLCHEIYSRCFLFSDVQCSRGQSIEVLWPRIGGSKQRKWWGWRNRTIGSNSRCDGTFSAPWESKVDGWRGGSKTVGPGARIAAPMAATGSLGSRLDPRNDAKIKKKKFTRICWNW